MPTARDRDPDLAPRNPGRPRDPRADRAILGATLDLLTEVGFGLTVDAVAQRAGVGKATIYRRWDSKEQLMLDALSTELQPVAAPDTGDVRTDLMSLYAPMTEPVAQQTAVRLMPALAAEAAANPVLAERLRAFVSLRRAPARAVLQQAVERGEVDAAVDLDLAIDLLTGSLLSRLFFTGGRVDRDIVGQVIDLVLRAIKP